MYLCHDSVGSSGLLVLKHDVRIAIDNQLSELLALASHPTLGQPTRAQSMFRHIGGMLFEHQWRHLACATAESRPASRSTWTHCAT